MRTRLRSPAALGIGLGGLAGAGVCALLLHVGGAGLLYALTRGVLPWYVTRAAAITAYILLTGSMLLGLSITSKTRAGSLNRADAFTLHQFLSWLAWGFVGLHVGALLVDTYQPFSVIDVLVPFASAYRTAAVALGVIGLYLIAVLVTSFSLRTRIGHRAWRAIHFSSFLLFVIATLHGIFAGSSSGLPAMQLVYLFSGGAVGLMLLYRIARSRARPGAGRATVASGRSTRLPSV